MRAILNELSLAEACRCASLGHQPLAVLLNLRTQHPQLGESLYCSKELLSYRVDGDKIIKTLVMALSRDQRVRFLKWVTSKGPFYDDERNADVDGDLFIYKEIEVTSLGMGEAAAILSQSKEACLFSPMVEPIEEFQLTPLNVEKESNSGPSVFIRVPNYWAAGDLADRLTEAEPEPQSWNELIELSSKKFDRLLIGSHCGSILNKNPFCPIIARAIAERLSVLQVIMENRAKTGEFLPKAKELHQLHFQGSDPLFSDESATNKSDFLSAMTFPDPNGASKVTYFWHGKIKRRQFRIHFDWPLSKTSKQLKVAYIGPKISKS